MAKDENMQTKGMQMFAALMQETEVERSMKTTGRCTLKICPSPSREKFKVL